MLINNTCKECLTRQNINAFPEAAAQDEIAAYQQEVRNIIERSDGLSTPQVAEKLYALRDGMFGPVTDFAGIKRHFNDLMMSLLPYMERQVEAADDQLKAAMQFAMVGNFIDFGAMSNVDEKDLQAQIDGAADIPVAPDMLEAFRNEIVKAGRLVYFTDNCGEIVTDKLLISVMRDINPGLKVTVIVRGRPAVNDATMEDAEQVGMGEAAHRVIGNGTGMPGNVIGAISDKAMDEIDKADVMVAKGQGNYEGLSGCGLNIFYLFLCKCDLFRRRFNVPAFAGIITHECLQR